MRITNFCDKVYHADNNEENNESHNMCARIGDSLLSGWNCLLGREAKILNIGPSGNGTNFSNKEIGKVDTVWKVISLFPIFPIIGVIFKALAMLNKENRLMQMAKCRDLSFDEANYIRNQVNARMESEYQSRQNHPRGSKEDFEWIFICCAICTCCCGPERDRYRY